MKSVSTIAALGLAATLAISACSSKGTSPVAKSFLRTTLAQGTWNNLPPSPLYISVVDFPQPQGENAPTGGHMHPPGFVFGLTGDTQVNLDDGSKVTIGPGQAIYATPFVHHSHSNPGPGPDDWLFIGPRTETVRNQPLPSPEAVALFNGPTLSGLQTGSTYQLSLDMVTMRPGGQSPVERQGGPTVVYVLDGQMSLHRQSGTPQQLKWGQTAFLTDGEINQLRNDSPTDQARALVMTFWLATQPAETAVNTSLT